MYILLFLAAFLAAEIMVISLVGGAIGGLATFGLLALGAIAGGWVINRQGARSQQALLLGAAQGNSPFDALFGLLAGLLFIFPGFISDALALLLLIPPVRLLLLAVLGSFLMKRLLPRMQGARFARFYMPGQNGSGNFSGFGGPAGSSGPGGNDDNGTFGGTGGFYHEGRSSGFGAPGADSDDIIIEGEFRDVTEETRAREAAGDDPAGRSRLLGRDGKNC